MVHISNPTTEVSPYPEVLAKLEQGKIVALSDLVTAVARPPSPDTRAVLLPTSTRLSKAEREALKVLPEVYGSVVPTSRRMLDPAELSQLLRERTVLCTVLKAVERRKDDISLTVLNHNDVAWEQQAKDGGQTLVDRDGQPLLNKDGHIVRKTRLRGDDQTETTHFSVETRAGTPAVDPVKLRDLAGDPEVDYIDHRDYLAVTKPDRVLDEHAAMIYLRNNPRLLRAFAEAAVSGTPVVSVYQREQR